MKRSPGLPSTSKSTHPHLLYSFFRVTDILLIGYDSPSTVFPRGTNIIVRTNFHIAPTNRGGSKKYPSLSLHHKREKLPFSSPQEGKSAFLFTTRGKGGYPTFPLTVVPNSYPLTRCIDTPTAIMANFPQLLTQP